MKKFLSLVLSLIMVMSLVTINAGAADFTDDDKITYVEAADVISTIGVMDGNAGAFNPEGGLTRRAAAKIICNMLLGPTTASALHADAAPFPDVPANNEFAGYIAYCAKEGIIGGYADGTFKPANPLSGYAFMKMLLGALGYDSAIEGFAGPNWSVQVAKVALGIGLDKDLEGDFDGTKAVNREQAALYAFNTLKANVVDYEERGFSWTVNGVTMQQRPSKAAPVPDNSQDGTGSIVSTRYQDNIDNDGLVQFAEVHFNKLTANGQGALDSGTDAFCRPANVWRYDGDDIGTYALTPNAVYTKNTPEADIYDDLAMTDDEDFFVYIDGVEANTYKDAAPTKTFYKHDTNYDVHEGSDPARSYVTVRKGEIDNELGNGKGATIYAYKSNNGGENLLCIVNTYVGEVTAVEAADGKRAAYIELARVGDDTRENAAYGVAYDSDGNLTGDHVLDEAYTFETTGFDVGDIVTFNYRTTAGKESVKNVQLAEEISGTVKSFTSTKKFSLDDKSYDYGAKNTSVFGSSDVGTTATVYADENGYVLYTKEGDDNNKNYAMVLNFGSKSSTDSSSNEVWLLYTDGTTGVVTTDKDYHKDAKTAVVTFAAAADNDIHKTTDGLEIGDWVTYKTNKSGKVVLTKRANWTSGFVGMDSFNDYGKNAAPTGQKTASVNLKNGDTRITLANDSTNLRVNAATVIIVRDDDGDFKVYNGVKNMPSLYAENGTNKSAAATVAGVSYYKKDNDKFVRFLFIDLEAQGDEVNNLNFKMDNGTNNVIFLKADKGAKLNETDSDSYYTFDAVVDGKIIEDLMLDATDKKTLDVIDKLTNGDYVLLNDYAVDSDFYTVNEDNEPDAADDEGDVLTTGGVKRISGSCFEFGGNTYYTAEDCVFFRVDNNGHLRSSNSSALKTGDIGTGDKDYYKWVGYTVNNDTEITGVYWVLN